MINKDCVAKDYVEGLRDGTQLLDLLSTGADAADGMHVLSGGRGPLYPEVKARRFCLRVPRTELFPDLPVSSTDDTGRWHQSW